MADGINTGGGASSSGDVTPGKDFIGRDIVNNNYSPLPERLSDYFRDELRDLKERVRSIEKFLAGDAVGTPGLSSQVQSIKMRIEQAEREIEVVDMMEKRLERLEALILGYTRNNVSLDKYVFLGVMALLFIAIPFTVWLVLWGKG